MLEPTRRPVLSHKVVPRQKIKLGVSVGRFGAGVGRLGADVGRLVCVCVGSAFFVG